MAFEMTNGATGPADDAVFRQFQEAEAAPAGALPAGTYPCVCTDGRFARSKIKGTPSYKLKFEVADGQHKGRLVWHDCYLTAAAVRHSKGILTAFGVMDVAKPLDGRFACLVTVRPRVADDGSEHTEVKAIRVLKRLEPFAFEEDADGRNEWGAGS
jgi:hypothetical protein